MIEGRDTGGEPPRLSVEATMSQSQVSFDGRWYVVEIRHNDLNKYEIVRAKSEYEVREKAAAKLAQWNQAWVKKAALQQAAYAREAAARTKEAKKELAGQRTTEAQAVVGGLDHILADTLSRDDRLNWDGLKDHTRFGKPKPEIPAPTPLPQPSIPPPPVRGDAKYTPQLGLLDHIIAKRKEAKLQRADALYDIDYRVWQQTKESIGKQALADRKDFEQRLAAWRAQVQDAEKQWEAERKQFGEEQARSNATIDQLKEQYLSGSHDAVLAYCNQVLTQSQYPPVLPQPEFGLDYDSETKILVVEYVLPGPEDMPRLKGVKYVQSWDALDEVPLSESVVNSLYDRVVYQIVLRTIHELYEADTINALEAIVFNGWVNSIDKATGQVANACIVSVHAGRSEFLAINLGLVNPKECFRKLKGVGSSELHGLSAVPPVLQMDRNDSRFISSREIAEGMDEGTNLAAMDWEDFEHLIRELFEQEFAQGGGEVKVTQASRDRGVDAVAFDPDPIRGGKIVIQAKRYTNTVDVSAVRDLYGTVVNEGATKGILVTTSNYGPEAYEFAKGKPLTLLTGGNLLSLLEKHGHKARIDLAEAKRLQQEGL